MPNGRSQPWLKHMALGEFKDAPSDSGRLCGADYRTHAPAVALAKACRRQPRRTFRDGGRTDGFERAAGTVRSLLVPPMTIAPQLRCSIMVAIHVINVNRIDPNIEKVVSVCGAAPYLTVRGAFFSRASARPIARR